MTTTIIFPALQTALGRKSDSAQKSYFWLIGTEYALLIGAAVMGMDFEKSARYYVVYTLIFFVGFIIMLVRSLLQPEQDWYRARAATESIKTSAWRYMMKAHPYDDAEAAEVVNLRFRKYILQLTRTNTIIKDAIDAGSIEGQVTAQMRNIRCQAFEQRKKAYLIYRINDQHDWYLRKAKANRAAFRTWVFLSGIFYMLAILFSLWHIAKPAAEYLPVEALTLCASLALGWLQIKKHSELAAAYTLTAVEIGLAKEVFLDLDSEIDFSNFVNDTELVFSREHTQWVARQQTAGG